MARFEMTPKQQNECVRNILWVFDEATQEEIDNGLNWYARARQDAEAMAKRHEVALNVTVAVMAALSPNNRWERNLMDADALIGAYMDGEAVESVSVCTYNKMREKAWDILAFAHEPYNVDEDLGDVDLLHILKGQKICSFFENIMGYDSCTIDGHARNIAYGERLSLSGSKFTIGKAEYAALQECYRIAAEGLSEVKREVGDERFQKEIQAFEVQAITWVVWRRIHGI